MKHQTKPTIGIELGSNEPLQSICPYDMFNALIARIMSVVNADFDWVAGKMATLKAETQEIEDSDFLNGLKGAAEYFKRFDARFEPHLSSLPAMEEDVRLLFEPLLNQALRLGIVQYELMVAAWATAELKRQDKEGSSQASS